jgi:release factor glutamine methyltransferase
MTLRAALEQGSRILEEASVAAPRLTAEVLLCHALRKDRIWLYSHPEEELSRLPWIHYGRYLYQRMGGTPTQYITKRQEFYGREFLVTPDVLIPRPETEHVIEVALSKAPLAGPAVDIGCGSGALAVTWQLETGTVCWGTDISAAALRIAQENARRLKAEVNFVACDLASAFAPRSFHLVLSNPPYIPDPEGPWLQREVRDHEPAVALFGGPTGVEIYERLIADAARVLAPSGWLVIEIGYQSQDSIIAMLDASWTGVLVTADLAGWPRVVSAQYVP